MAHTFSVAFATGSRAEYGIVRKYLRLLDQDEHISLSILVTGALLSEKYAHQVELIYKDGFRIEAELDIEMDSSSNATISHSMALALEKFSKLFALKKYDLLIILGDRFEMLSVATAAAMERIPILHIHGGEATFGNYDEFIRHCITKMATYHFTATDEYRRRVIQLGENPDTVFYLGSLGAENCLNINEAVVSDEIKNLKDSEYFVVLFHPETLTGVRTLTQINELLSAIERFPGYRFVFLGTNADTYSDIIRNRVSEFVASHSNSVYFENLPSEGYHYLVKQSKGLIGNSSSGLIEAPSLGVLTVNIGDRQAGRVRGNSVIDVECNQFAIERAIKKMIRSPMNKDIINPYFRSDAASNYYSKTVSLLETVESDTRYPKRFYDCCSK